MTLARLTELEAVNEILSVLGEAPVNTLGDEDNPTITAVSAARRALKMASRALQNQAWSFNTEYDYDLTPDGDGFLTVPSNCIRVDVDPLGSDSSLDVVLKGTRLYNKADHTFVFEDPITCTLVLLLEFDELPEAARNYIMIRAARKLQDQMAGNDALHVYTAQDELEAKLDFLSAEADDADHNILADPDTFNIIDRQ
jgi:hypothetical protein